VEFDGQQIGVVETARFSGDFGLQDVSGIGDNVVIEYVPGIAHISVSASGILLLNKNLISAGLAPGSSVRDILNGKVFDIGLFSRASGAWLLKAIDCSFASIDVGVNSGRAAELRLLFQSKRHGWDS
jgi:hypothetical protein